MSEKKKNEILEQAITLLYDDPLLSMENIAKKLNIARSLLYRYFETRDKLIVAAYAKSHEDFMNLIIPILDEPISGKEKYIKFLKSYIPLSYRNDFLRYNTLYRNYEKGNEHHEEKNVHLLTLATQMKEEGDLDVTLSDEWFVALTRYFAVASWEVIKAGDVGKNTVANNIDTLLFKNRK